MNTPCEIWVQSSQCFWVKDVKIQRMYVAVQNTGRPKAVLFMWILFVIYVSRLTLLYCQACSLQPCDQLLGKGWPLGSLVCDVSLCIIVTFSYGSRVRCGTWWYRSLVFAFFFTFHIQFEYNLPNGFRENYVLIYWRDFNMSDLGWKVNPDFWNLFIAHVSIG